MKLYLETTVPNFLFATDSPDKQAETVAFWEWLKLGTEGVFVSRLVEREIAQANEPLRSQLYRALADVWAQPIDIPPEAVGLAQVYVARGVVSARHSDDALHIAIATCEDLDVVVSWNLKHIVKMKTIEMVSRINMQYGLAPIRIHTPPEVMP